MKFSKYSAIYRNDNLTINDEEIIGKVHDVKEYLRYELANQCMSHFEDFEYENLIDNADMIIDLIQELDETQEDTLKIKVYYNPMGALQYTTFVKEV